MNSHNASVQQQDAATRACRELEPQFPLTPVQAGMFYESTLAGSPRTNVEQIVVRMHDVNESALRSAWQWGLSHHAALRCSVDWTDPDGPSQMPLSIWSIHLEIKDWTVEADVEGSLARFLDSDRNRGADASALRGWRLVLIRLPANESALVWTFPHSLLDGRSFTIVLREVFAHYDSVRADRPPPPFNIRPEFSAHCHAAATMSTLAGKKHFAAHLAGMEQTPSVGLDMPVDAPPGAPKAVREFRLDRPTTRLLTSQAAHADATLATVINAAWGVLLARTSRTAAPVFGVTRSGRHLLPESEAMVGCLINTLPLCVRLDAGLTLQGLLRQVRTSQLAQRPHEHLSLTDIRAASGLPADLPLFETLVMYERSTLSDGMAALGNEWANRRVELHEEGALPLTLAAYGEDELLVRIEHDPARVSDAAAARYAAYLEMLLREMSTASLDAPVSTLQILSPAEIQKLIRFSAPARPTRGDGCVVAAFEAMAAARSRSIAVSEAGGRKLTFGELKQAANQLASLLVKRGASSGDIIALCLPRSVNYVVGMLAVLKTGAAFLPLDPTYPVESLSYMLKDSAASLLITDSVKPWMAEHAAIGMDALPTGAQIDAPPPRIASDPARAAYVIYTSGTTGKPKGVVVPMGAMAEHAVAAIELFKLTADDHVLQFTSLSFDVSIEEIIPTLLAGARVVLRTENAALDPRELMSSCYSEAVTVLNLPTAFWQTLLDEMTLAATRLPDAVRLVVVGGEKVPAATLQRWREISGVEWINGYGPTEATITSAAFVLPIGDPFSANDVPVGRPLAHSRLYVLCPDLTLAPRGVTGELWIGGHCVATGYLRQPELSATRFLPDPFVPGERMYRSGDLARWSPDGTLFLSGRADRQVKLRGYRIEPGEIERVLEDLPEIEKALVGLLDAELPNARLIAWVRPAANAQTLDTAAVESAAARALPPHMRPRIQPVHNWPEKPGGKIDVARLPVPEAATTTGAVAQCDEGVRRVADMFATLLGHKQVPHDASFFSLGGHSLMLIRLLAMLEAGFGIRLPAGEVHAAPTPIGIAELLARRTHDSRPLLDCIMPIQPLGSRPPLYGVHVLGINGSYFRPVSKVLGTDQPVFGLTVGLLSEKTPTGIAETAQLYHRVIDEHYPKGPVGLIAVSLGSYVALELAQRLEAAGRQVTLLALLDADGPDGRPRLSRFSRIGVHLRRLRHEGLRYVEKRAAGSWENLLHSCEVLRRKVWHKISSSGAPINSIAAFVAANEIAVRDYRPRPYRGRLTIVRAAENRFDSPHAIASGLGWKSLAAGGFDLVDVPGDHMSILEKPAAPHLAAVVLSAIARSSTPRD